MTTKTSVPTSCPHRAKKRNIICGIFQNNSSKHSEADIQRSWIIFERMLLICHTKVVESCQKVSQWINKKPQSIIHATIYSIYLTTDPIQTFSLVSHFLIDTESELEDMKLDTTNSNTKSEWISFPICETRQTILQMFMPNNHLMNP